MAEELPINPFFAYPPPGDPPVPPKSLYARTIERGEEGQPYLLFDAIDAARFDLAEIEVVIGLSNPAWRAQMLQLPVYAVEVKGQSSDVARDWLVSHQDDMPEWVRLDLTPDPAGPAMLYGNILGLASPVQLTIETLNGSKRLKLEKATDLNDFETDDAGIGGAVPTRDVNHIVVLDVGQGAANALVDVNGAVVAYVDLGSGVLADWGTWPPALTDLCLVGLPPVILTHWHYDHFEAANRLPLARALPCIAPVQPLGPGPQAAFAAAVSATLLTRTGPGPVRSGAIKLERCTGPSGNQNRTGIAVWVEGPVSEDPVLLPGDAGYSDVPGIVTGDPITSLVVSHHGGFAPGTPPTNPSLPESRAAFSFGLPNGYGHPLPASITRLRGSPSFAIGYPAARLDDRRTVSRSGGLGHIGLRWASSNRLTPHCTCGCTITPTQW